MAEPHGLRKSTHPTKFNNHVTVHRLSVSLHHRETNVQSHTFYLQSWPKGLGTPPLFHLVLYGICS